MNNPLYYVAALLVSGYVFRIWLLDLRSFRRQQSAPAAEVSAVPAGKSAPKVAGPLPVFPGATPVGRTLVLLAVGGALVLLSAETGGEYALGITAGQTKMTLLFGLYTLAAAFVEELIFRGYLYYDRGTRAQLVGSILGVSIVFAALHPYIWNWKMPEGTSSWQFWQGRLSLELGSKAVFSTAFVFVRSLWFYSVRFVPANRWRSLIPCIAAHLATNVGVLAIKGLQGSVSGWY